MNRPIEQPYAYHTTPYGLRIVHVSRPYSQVEYLGVMVRAGSRNEGSPDSYGIAHFVEHTIFKGTAKRSAWNILNRMEAVGGELNAYTTKEETAVYTCAPYGHFTRALELITDLVANSRFPERELDKERQVVEDEIESYLDSPADRVYDDFDDMIFKGMSLGHNILGDKQSLAHFDSGKCRAFIDKWYAADNMVVFYSGSRSVASVFSAVERYMSVLPLASARAPRQEISAVSPFEEERSIDSHQSHNVMGARIPGMYDDNRRAWMLLTNILGGPGMNSLLNVALRERRALVYNVEASAVMYTDIGLFSIYFGCDHDDSKKCIKIARQTIERLAESKMTERQLSSAKKQYIGQLQVAAEHAENNALAIARATLFHGSASTVDSIAQSVETVTAEKLRECAQGLLPLSILSLG